MKKWSKVLAIVLCIAMALTLCACGPKESGNNDADNNNDNQQNNTPATLTMGTGGESGVYYAFGGVLASYLGSETGLNVNVVSTGGTKANIVGINEGEFELATVQSDVATYAFEGSNGYDATDTFRVLGALYAETVQIVTVNPDIKSVSDLAGKNVCVGDVGSGTYYNTIDVLAAYGMTIDDINPVYQSFADSTESLKDGKIDVAFLCAGAPTTAVVELATSKDVYLISIDDEHMTKLLDACPWYAALTIPGGTYDGFDEDTNTITVKCTLVCSADLDDDTAYTIVSTIFDNAEDIAALHGKGAELDLTFATEGIAIPFSAGAARYYAEHDITVETA